MVEDAHQAHRVYLRKLCEARLADRFVAGEVAEGLALRERKLQHLGALFEAPRVQASEILQEVAKTSDLVHVPGPGKDSAVYNNK